VGNPAEAYPREKVHVTGDGIYAVWAKGPTDRPFRQAAWNFMVVRKG
jgi:hypothetical protein